jgi:signal transduction histidine kinase/ligand-binding sensor domain-containing protein
MSKPVPCSLRSVLLFLRPWRICFLLFQLATAAWAVDPHTLLTQYGHTAWRVRDGAFSGEPTVITQTTDGFIWIGTTTSLVRFDGLKFVPWVPPNGNHLPGSIAIYGLLGGKDGSLWIGTGGNLSRLKQGILTNYSDGLGRINGIIEDRNGTVWITRSRPQDQSGPLCEVRGTKLRCYGKADGITPAYAVALALDNEGYFWIGSSAVITRWKAGSSIEHRLSGSKSRENLLGVNDLAAGRDGSMWVGMADHGPGLGLQQVVRGVWRPFIVPGFDSSKLQVTSLLLDRENALWIGTETHGIYRIHEGTVDRFSAADGLSSDTIQGFYEDREGNLWVATPEGVDCFHDIRVVSFSTREGLVANQVRSVVAARDGTVWVGNHAALESLRSGRASSISRRNGLPGNQVTSLLEDHQGGLWVGVDDKLAIYENGRFNLVRGFDGTSIGAVIALAEDADHNIWAEVVGKKLLRIQAREVRAEIPARQVPQALSLAADPKGGIWLGLSDGGLAHYRNGHVNIFPSNESGLQRGTRQVIVSADGAVLGAAANGMIVLQNQTLKTLKIRNGLPCDHLLGIISDQEGAIWLYAACGMIRIENSQLQQWWNREDTTIKASVFDVYDGVRPSYTPFQPAASRSPDGRLWFANDNVLQMIDPAHLTYNKIPPPLFVEEVIADHKRYSPGNHLSLPPLTRDIEIDFTALSFVVPQKVYFRYMLEGHDSVWREATTRRQAFYSDLRPGAYRFHVIACNNDGLWNNQDEVLSFTIAPAWFQTIWFRAFCGCGFLSLLWMLYQLRLRQLQLQFNRTLEARVSERSRIARELHDTLLQSFQGVVFLFQGAANLLPAGEARQKLEGALDHAEQAIIEGRDAVHEMRSSEAAGELSVAISVFAEELAASQTGGESPMIGVRAEGAPRPLNTVLRDEAYRIAVEALRNAFQHAQAHQIGVEIVYGDRRLLLRVRDDGKGMDADILDHGRGGHFGLAGMRERAKLIGGSLEVRSKAGSGTEVELAIPSSIAYTKSRPTRRWFFGRFRHRRG